MRIFDAARTLIAAATQLEQDISTGPRPPTGDDYNALWEKLEEFKAVFNDISFADATQIQRARDEYAVGSDDDVEIDDPAVISEADEGVWVQAWVYLRNEEN